MKFGPQRLTLTACMARGAQSSHQFAKCPALLWIYVYGCHWTVIRPLQLQTNTRRVHLRSKRSGSSHAPILIVWAAIGTLFCSRCGPGLHSKKSRWSAAAVILVQQYSVNGRPDACRHCICSQPYAYSVVGLACYLGAGMGLALPETCLSDVTGWFRRTQSTMMIGAFH